MSDTATLGRLARIKVGDNLPGRDLVCDNVQSMLYNAVLWNGAIAWICRVSTAPSCARSPNCFKLIGVTLSCRRPRLVHSNRLL